MFRNGKDRATDLGEHNGLTPAHGHHELGKDNASHASLKTKRTLSLWWKSLLLTWMITPTMLWTHMRTMADGHSSVIARPPYLFWTNNHSCFISSSYPTQLCAVSQRCKESMRWRTGHQWRKPARNLQVTIFLTMIPFGHLVPWFLVLFS